MCFVHIKRKVPLLHFTREEFRFDKAVIVEHLQLGLPMGFQSSIIAIGAVVLQIALNGLGPVAVAAFAAAHRVDGIAVMPMMSFGVAIAAYTAQNFGAQKFDRISDGVKKTIWMSCSFSFVAAAFNIYFGDDVIKLFVGAEQTTIIEYGRLYLVVSGVCYWVLSLLFIFRFTLQGLGKSFVPTFAGLMELAMRIVAAFFLVEYWGYLGACLASPMAWIGACLPLAIAFFITRKKMLLPQN